MPGGFNADLLAYSDELQEHQAAFALFDLVDAIGYALKRRQYRIALAAMQRTVIHFSDENKRLKESLDRHEVADAVSHLKGPS